MMSPRRRMQRLPSVRTRFSYELPLVYRLVADLHLENFWPWITGQKREEDLPEFKSAYVNVHQGESNYGPHSLSRSSLASACGAGTSMADKIQSLKLMCSRSKSLRRAVSASSPVPEPTQARPSST